MRVENKMKLLSICIPTYKQPEMIREMLIRCLDIYYESGVDLYIYDSSPDDETESVVRQYKEQYKNLYYKHLPADIHSNIKVLRAYREIIGMGQYEYLWLCPDYIQLTRMGLECVLDHCRKKYDICVLNYRDVEKLGEKEYSDVNTFFWDCAWHMSSYMATIIRLPSFSNVEWNEFYKRYTTSRRINHSHVAFYFEQLVKLPEIKAVHIPVSSGEIRVSPYRKESLWKKELFIIWCEYWPDMIYALPDQYQDKESVIKRLGVNTGIFAWDNFVSLRREGVYNLKIYSRYRKKWKCFTNVPKGLLWMLALIPSNMINILKPSSLKKYRMNRKLQNFCAGHQEIYLYGCGFIARKTSILLDKMQIRYQGYIVSDCANEKESFHGLPVISFEDLYSKKQDIGIIMSLNRDNTIQLMKDKKRLGAYKLFYMYEYEDLLE
jgi:glycosyltransferase involved in cell wall biosynthesis